MPRIPRPSALPTTPPAVRDRPWRAGSDPIPEDPLPGDTAIFCARHARWAHRHKGRRISLLPSAIIRGGPPAPRPRRPGPRGRV